MDFIGLIYLLIAHYLCGRGCLQLFKVQLKPIATFCLSMIVGVPLLSLVPCVLQLSGIAIYSTPVYLMIAVFSILFSMPLLAHFKMPKMPKIGIPAFYEWPFLIVCILFIIVSLWRCFYLPPYARDMLSGPELLAEFTVRERTMINSVFTVELSSTNNYFKSPYITSLQIMYKLLVTPFGQVWLSVLFLPFMAWVYTLLRERLHPMLASFLLLFFLIIPDMYAYSYVMLYDYSNMIFFFAGFYFILKFLDGGRMPDLIFSGFLFGLATYIRSETLVLVAMVMPLPMYYMYKHKWTFKKAVPCLVIFLGISAAFYVLCIDVFVRNFIPFTLDVGSEVNFDPHRIPIFFTRLKDMAGLIFSPVGTDIYGYFIYVFCLLLIADLVYFRRINREARNALYGIAVVYFGLAFLGYIIPLVDVINTSKRGLEKALPLMLLYMANSASVLRLSDVIKNWLSATPKKEVTPGSE